MTQGLCNSPAVFMKVMNQVLGDLEFVFVYIDDITIFSISISKHLEHLRIVLNRLELANIKLNPHKCQWFAEKVKLLGFMISSEGIHIDPDKIKALKEKKPPVNKNGLHSTLVGFNYYRHFISNNADRTKCLYNFLRDGVEWNWSDECQKSYYDIIRCLTDYPILRPADETKPYILYTDACNDTIGADFSQ